MDLVAILEPVDILCKVLTSNSFLPHIRIINENEIDMSTSINIGSGRFSICYLARFSHYQVCVKVSKDLKSTHVINEANIISQFSHSNLPYLFGVCTKKNSIIMSYHGFNNQTLSLHDVLHPNSDTTDLLQTFTINWINLLQQITAGLNCLHSNYKILHNDIKFDNIVLAPGSTPVHLKAVIIDFNKACKTGKGKYYRLSDAEKEKYKKDHQHIAPDLRDGHCQQSIESDIYSLGKIINGLCINSFIDNKNLLEVSNKCLEYNKHNCPSITNIAILLSG